jgi:hypothetical protein
MYLVQDCSVLHPRYRQVQAQYILETTEDGRDGSGLKALDGIKADSADAR